MNKEALVRKHGWNTWYNEDYWINEDYVRSLFPNRPKESYDYTNYGVSLDIAYRHTLKQLKYHTKLGKLFYVQK